MELMDHAGSIEVADLSKQYDGVPAITDISFDVKAGEIFGLLGPNGAGKSTTLRILITLLRPSAGTATVLGHDVVQEADQVRRQIGYVPQERAIDRFLTGREHLWLLANLYHLPKEDALRRIDEDLYGFCEETGEPISVRRLEARPIATLSIESQERHERMERTHRDS